MDTSLLLQAWYGQKKYFCPLALLCSLCLFPASLAVAQQSTTTKVRTAGSLPTTCNPASANAAADTCVLNEAYYSRSNLASQNDTQERNNNFVESTPIL